MNHDEQVSMLKRLLCLREEKRDDKMLDDVVTIPVTKYTDAELFRQEVASTFSAFPLVVGNVATLREPGTFVLHHASRLRVHKHFLSAFTAPIRLDP